MNIGRTGWDCTVRVQVVGHPNNTRCVSKHEEPKQAIQISPKVVRGSATVQTISEV